MSHARRVVTLCSMIVLTAVLSLAWSPPALAADIYVENLTGSDASGNGSMTLPYASIGAALSTASSGDTVWVGLGSYEETVTLVSGVDVIGLSPAVCTISGQGGVYASAVTGCTVRGFTITGGNAFAGGGMRAFSSELTLQNLRFSANSALMGGGLAAVESDVAITGCEFSANSGGAGGAAYLTTCTVSFDQCELFSNDGGMAGTISANATALTMTDCLLTDNTATFVGAGLAVHGGSVVLDRCILTRNGSPITGGAISANLTDLDAIDCTLSSNSAAMGGAANIATSTADFTRCTISGNTASMASGGVTTFDTDVTYTDCDVVGNSAGWQSGGISATGHSLALDGCTIVSNSGGLGGGGVIASDCSVAATNTVISANTAMSGAGLLANNSPANLVGCTFEDNHASMQIGAVNAYLGPLQMTDCTVTGNSGGWAGGGVSVYGTTGTITDTVFADNSTLLGGGGLMVVLSTVDLEGCDFDSNSAMGSSGSSCQSSTVTFDRTTFENNTASAIGAAVGASASNTSFTNCLATGNAATGGSVIILGNGTGTFTNCTIADNTVGSPGVAVEASGTAAVSIRNSVLWGNGGTDTTRTVVTYSDTQQGVAGAGNISIDPGFMGAGDYHLLSSSACIDAASNAVAPAVDRDGVARPIDGDADMTATADMGAYEFEVPVATPDAYVTSEDNVLVVINPSLLANDAWPGTLTAEIVTAASHGTANVTSTGAFTYAPATNFNGVDEFSYRFSDGTLYSQPATVTITVTPTNDRPTGSADASACAEDGYAVIELLGNDSDIDGDPLTTFAASICGHGVVEVGASGIATYTPDPDWSGTDTFYYRATDGDLDSNMIRVDVVVSAVNDAPVAIDNATSCSEDGAASINVLANDTDVEDDSLLAALVSGPTHGGYTFYSNGTFLYTPNANWYGTDTLTYRAYDGVAYSMPATCTITVTPVNDAPAALGESFAATEDTPLTIAPVGVLANDTDVEGTPLTAHIFSAPTHGAVALLESGGFLYVPEADYTGADSFSYRAFDGESYSAPVVASIDVTGTQDAPVAHDDTFTVAEDTLLSAPATGVLANDIDPDSEPITAALADDVDHGSLALAADGSFAYTPDADFFGSDSFTYRASDGTDSSNLAIVEITVDSVNDAPASVPESYTVDQDTTLTVAAPGVLGNDSDVDGDALDALEVAPTSHGTLELAADGSFIYRPDAGFVGLDAFDYAASDDTTDSGPVSVGIQVLDTMAPVTSCDTTATYYDLAMISLTATDNASGIAETCYALDGAAPCVGTAITCDVLGDHEIEFWSVDGVGNAEEPQVRAFTILPSQTGYSALAGADRFETAVQISQRAFPAGADSVIVATGEQWPDALGAAALAGAMDAPIVLTEGSTLPDCVRAEIERLGATSAVVVGGESAIGSGVFDDVATLVGPADTTRIGGVDRHATSRLLAAATVARLGAAYDGTCFVATDGAFPDALAAGPLSAARGWPVYLADGEDIPLATLSAMRTSGATDVLILGGEAAVTPIAEWRLETTFGYDHVRRLFGGTRYRTAVEVAKYGVGHAGLIWDGVAIATGQQFPDALTGGVAQARAGSVLTLTPSASLDDDLREVLTAERDRIGDVVYLGGTQAVSDVVRFEVAQILR